jgi:hypothetical protein
MRKTMKGRRDAARRRATVYRSNANRVEELTYPDEPIHTAHAISYRQNTTYGTILAGIGNNYIYVEPIVGRTVNRLDIIFNGNLNECLDVIRDMHHSI